MRARIRGWVVLVYTAASMVTFFLLSLPDTLLGRGQLAMWFARFAWSRSILRLAGARVRVLRLPPLPDGPLIFASNHESALDILALVARLPRTVRFIAKLELFKIPVFGLYMRLGGHIPVDRGNHARAIESLRQAGAAVRGGTSLIVFPEGTRSTDLRVHPFKKGPFVVAMEAGVPVVPVAISGAGRITPKRAIAVYPGEIRIALGDPVDPRAFPNKTALLVEVRRRVIEQHLAIGGAGGDTRDAVAAPGREGTSASADGAPV
ncbi:MULTISPECIES: lysophospholipid acyltransferase family protein [Anaeromyxobacter]|uniref:lysophospholipid acyltransferase family protein n=1 Tax=Anaeromyxobacter TaxID=161492 RepID=UPI001F59230F|nr:MULTISPECIES: lysophospholipid acyltransferase family protein [unclassified Anaeromyxobacter]